MVSESYNIYYRQLIILTYLLTDDKEGFRLECSDFRFKKLDKIIMIVEVRRFC